MKQCEHIWLEHETKVIFNTKNGKYIIYVRICKLCAKIQVRSGRVVNGTWRPK